MGDKSYIAVEKQRIIKLTQKYGIYIIEGDYMGDFTKSTDLPLHYYDTSGHVTYLESFSMTVFSALRLGTIVLPQSLIQAFLEHKKIIDCDTNLIIQKALSLHLDSGILEKNLNYLSQVFREQVVKTIVLLSQFPNIQHYSASLQHLLIELPQDRYLGELKFTSKISYLEDSYLTAPRRRFIRIPNGNHLSETLNIIAK